MTAAGRDLLVDEGGPLVAGLVLTKATAEPGWEEPPDAVIRIQMRLSRIPQESADVFWAEVERVQVEEAERLAEVLADTLPEGTLQRLVGFILVRAAGARMGVAPLGDARAQYGDRAELDRVRTILEGAWAPGEISKGHPLHVLADQLVARVQAAETSERLAALAAREDLRAWLADLERAQNVTDVGDVAEAIRRRLGLPPCGSPGDSVHAARPAST